VPRQRALVGALLVLCLLLAQWIGLAHAIAHAHGQSSVDLQLAERGNDNTPVIAGLFDHAKASGACAALDAATLGTGPCSDIAMPPLQRAEQVPAPAVLLQRWHPPFVASFSSRAPPIDA
jgi:hypothetical protein